MKFRYLLLAFVLLVKFNSSLGQHKTRHLVLIPTDQKVYKVTTVPCDIKLKKGTIVTEEVKFSNKKREFLATTVDTLVESKVYTQTKPLELDVMPFEGKASLYEDEKDKSILHINYWLTHEKVSIDRKTPPNYFDLKITDRSKIDCKGVRTDSIAMKRLLNDTVFMNYYRVETSELPIEKTKSYYKHSSQIIEVLDKDQRTRFVLVSLDQDADYIIKLKNRDFISLNERSWNFSAITIPIKLRPKLEEGDVEIKEDWSASLNLGFFGGHTWGKYRRRYEKPNLKTLPSLSITVGGFVSAGTASLDSLSTRIGREPFKDGNKATIGVFSPGLGIVFSVFNFDLGVFYGCDMGVGADSRNWNYNRRGWLGFGLGYNIFKIGQSQ